MANPEHLKILHRGVEVWNQWRKDVWLQDLDPDLSEADLTGVKLQGVDFRRTDFTRATLVGAHLEDIDFRGANFTEANLFRAQLVRADLAMASFERANLCEADLRGAFLGVNLRNANLTKANLSGARFGSADLSYANLSGANLRGANLGEALFFNTDLTGAHLEGADLRNVRYTRVNLEKKFHIPSGMLAGAEATESFIQKPTPAAEPLHFTAYFPPELQPNQWHEFLVYAHVPGAIFEIKADSERRLGLQTRNYRQAAKEASTNVERGAEIVVVPEMAGCRFNPPRASLLWLEDWHRLEFKVQASPELPGFEPGTATNGRVAFYVGPILIAELKFWAVFSDGTEPGANLNYSKLTNDAYQSIFVSYSHQDSTIVSQLEKAYRVLGMRYLRDVETLRSGEEWNATLLKKIEEADIFQLCWSEAAKRSQYVEQEWRHAHNLKRPFFIRPTYWEQPIPEPPPELASIHFAYMQLKE